MFVCMRDLLLCLVLLSSVCNSFCLSAKVTPCPLHSLDCFWQVFYHCRYILREHKHTYPQAPWKRLVIELSMLEWKRASPWMNRYVHPRDGHSRSVFVLGFFALQVGLSRVSQSRKNCSEIGLHRIRLKNLEEVNLRFENSRSGRPRLTTIELVVPGIVFSRIGYPRIFHFRIGRSRPGRSVIRRSTIPSSYYQF